MTGTRTAGEQPAAKAGAAATRGGSAAPTAVRVTFLPSGQTAAASRGASLLDVAVKAGVEIDAPCGGQGRCGRCKVTVKGDGVARRPSAHLSAAEVEAGLALACTATRRGRRRPSPSRRPRSDGSGLAATPSPSPRPCRSPATGGRTPRCGWSTWTSNRPRWPTTRVTSTACSARWPSSTVSRRSAPSCRCSAASAATCAWPTGRSRSPSRCATGCTAPTCRRASSASTPASSASAAWASPSTSARRRSSPTSSTSRRGASSTPRAPTTSRSPAATT